MSSNKQLSALSSRYRELSIDSSNRSSGTTNDFIIPIPSNIGKIRGVTLLEAEIPYSFYNITSGHNKMNFKESGTEFTITIPDGNYNAIELGTIMTSLMNTTSPANIAVPNTRTYSVLFSNTSLKCTISCNSSFDIPLLTGSNILSNISDILGFTQNTDLTGAISYVGQGIAFLCSTSYLYLKSDLVEGTDAGIIVANNTTDKNILARIPLDSVPGDLLLYASNKENIIWFSSQRVVSQIRIYITLKNNIAVNLNGAGVTLKLGIYT